MKILFLKCYLNGPKYIIKHPYKTCIWCLLKYLNIRPKSGIKDNVVQPFIFLLRKLHAKEENGLAWSPMTQGKIRKLELESIFSHLSPAPISMTTVIGLMLLPLSFPFVWPMIYFLLHIEERVISFLFIIQRPQNCLSFPLWKDLRSPNQITPFFPNLTWEALLLIKIITLIFLVMISDNVWSWLTRNHRIHGQVSTPVPIAFGFSSTASLNLDILTKY